jgi:hypothetical protein
LDRVIAKKICDRGFAFWVQQSRPEMALGEQEPVLVCGSVAILTVQYRLGFKWMVVLH